MICPKCGNSIVDNSAFCSFCGAQIENSYNGSQNTISKGNKRRIVLPIGIAAVVLILICAFLIPKIASSNSRNSSNNNQKTSKNSYDSSSYEMSHSTYCMLYMDVSNVKVEHKSGYCYVSGTITNNGSYRVKYVKVKASCKDADGKVVNTDWTYAVGSSWLEPGESNQFEMMIKDSGYLIKKATVRIQYD